MAYASSMNMKYVPPSAAGATRSNIKVSESRIKSALYGAISDGSGTEHVETPYTK